MSIANEIISIKIREVGVMHFENVSFKVAERPYHSLALRINGDAYFSYDNTRTSSHAGNVFYMPSGCRYNAEYKNKNTILFIHFDSDSTSAPEDFTLPNPEVISELFYKIHKIWNQKEDGYYYKSLAVMCEIFQNISHITACATEKCMADAFEYAVDILENNYLSSDISIDKIVEISHMSNTYFRKLFLKKFGTTPKKYLISKRLIHAESLLACGTYSIKEVAELSGFSDEKYFSRTVKAAYGVPPSNLFRNIKICTSKS